MSYLLLIVFGMLGALSRYFLECLIHPDPLPLATLLINILGCFFITFFAQSSRFFRNLSPQWRGAISTGFIGSFTTLSAFLLEVIHFIQGGNVLIAAVYFALTVSSGLLACWLGDRVSNTLFHLKEEAK
ncbi:fluoride efflux transporter FluC [Sporolactobacillus kofuensis]|uniref:Fluoride-specific ion channel FluC n=1 Tax=Sporolactobacillus kofuensis TaxID=269672 RepID=A0ABW1WDZ9_9BACL|nr:CrcB family protein [Sporolactobacillus kofuensis]MCO7175790.1 CrcB family protein [Sporolactobacillus kofuensis]